MSSRRAAGWAASPVGSGLNSVSPGPKNRYCFNCRSSGTATTIGVRSAAWLRTEAPIPDDGSVITLVTDAPYELSVAIGERWAGAATIELLDAAERAVPAFADGPWTPPRLSQAVPRKTTLRLWTQSDAMILRLRDTTGRVLGLAPIVRRDDRTLAIR